MGSSLTHLRPLSAVISPSTGGAGREPAIGVAISRFSRAVLAPPTTQTNQKPPRPLHPSPVWRPTTRLRPLLAPPLDESAPPRPWLMRAQAQSLAVDALSNGVSARSAEREGAGTGREAAPPRAGMRLAMGSRGNHGSLPRTSHSAFLAYCKNFTETGVARLFTLLKRGRRRRTLEGAREVPAQ